MIIYHYNFSLAPLLGQLYASYLHCNYHISSKIYNNTRVSEALNVTYVFL